MVRTNIQTFSGEVEILSNLHVGSNLVANDTASNVLSVTGAIGANIFIGDGGLLSNIATTLGKIVDQGNVVANVVQFSSNTGYGGVGIVTDSNVGIQNTSPLHTLSIGDKVYFDTDSGSSEPKPTINVEGRIIASRFEGDGGLLSNIATTLQSIVDQGNVSANVMFIQSAAQFDSEGVGLVTTSNVGIQNTSPSHHLSVGSNLFVSDVGSNVLTVLGNVAVSNLNLGEFTITPSYGFNDVTNTSNGTTNVVLFQNTTTSLVADSNIVAAGNVTALQLISTANTEVGDRLKFSESNVYIDTLRVADVASSNLVTYDRVTGELTDSGGTFSNKFAVVSKQPPSVLSANATTVTNHGTYTLTTSNLATNSNTFNAFDGTTTGWVSSENYNGGGGGTIFHEDNLTQLSNLHPTQFGDWLAVEFPYKTTLRHMKLTPLTAAQYPTSANLYATNNDLTWSEIKYWKDVDPVTDSNVQTIVVNAAEQFKKYALVATKAKSAANVAIQDWQLFTESFSIDGGKVAMTQQAATGGETVMDQNGPHGRLPKTVPLKKYPEIAFDSGKFDKNGTTNVYVQAGYTISSSTSESDDRAPWKLFNNIFTEGNGWRGTGSYSSTDGSFTGTFVDFTNGGQSIATADRGEWLKITLPEKIKLDHFILQPRNSTTNGGHPISYGRSEFVKDGAIWGSNDGSSWSKVYTINATLPTDTSRETFTVPNSAIAYNNFVLVVTKTQGASHGAGANGVLASFSEWELYGYEEDPPAGDISVDTTFKSVMNTPQTTGANVYVDANLSSDFTNRVVGPTVSNTHTTYVSAGKYWELSGNVESNVTVEANTFLEGDAPHSVSVWFNSSNLEANASNSCIFSIGTDERLDHVGTGFSNNYQTVERLLPSDIESGDYVGALEHGVAMSTDGTKVIVGAYKEHANGTTDAGAAYIYTYSNGSWNETKLVSPDIEASAEFGVSVDMNSDGTKVIVGAYLEDTGGVSDSGAAYIFTYSNGSWDTGTKIMASDKAASDKFGYSVAMSGDGNRVIVGAHIEDEDENGQNTLTAAGSAYIFTYSGSSWDTGTKIVASNRSADSIFGRSVAINNDGTMAIVGASDGDSSTTTSTGSAYIFTYSSGSWSETKLLEASDRASGDRFGFNVAMSSDGTKVIVGAYEHHAGGLADAGAAYIFTYSSGTWDTGTKIVAPDKAADDEFGISVGMNPDGTKVIVGSWNEDPGDFRTGQERTNAGSAYIYNYDGSNWDAGTKIIALVGLDSDRFGRSVAINSDGSKAIVGAYIADASGANSGAAYIFTRDTTHHFTTDLKLQSNTWHNLTYAYQGEGGSRVTYLDGRKVAEDQAEDTYGNYPPFAMTGYSQGGYVATASTEYDVNGSNNDYEAWNAFDGLTGTLDYWSGGGGTAFTTGLYNNTSPFNFTGFGTPYETIVSGTTYTGDWIQLEMPHKLVLNSSNIKSGGTASTRFPRQGVFAGSNDGAIWDAIHIFSGLNHGTNETPIVTNSENNTKGYKYIRLIITHLNGQTYAGLATWKLYGHRENDLVRLPDPTNVLKYPHIVTKNGNGEVAVNFPTHTGAPYDSYAMRGYVIKASESIASYPAYAAFNGETHVALGTVWVGGYQQYGTGSGASAAGEYGGSRNLKTDLGTGGSATSNGAWLYIEMPHKIKVTSTKIVSYDTSPPTGHPPENLIIYGTNDPSSSGGWNVVDNTYASSSSGIPNNQDGKTWAVSTASSPTAYKYFALVIVKTNNTSTYSHAVVNDWQLIGTGVDSIPIQIGGGNIDKVANFRVYDKFIDEDQALEIWDAQKDEFERAKSSMTLHKGRLGIGTTEPEGKLAVLDEPNVLEEFPPGALSADKTYIEGHGEFCVSTSNIYDSNYTGYEAFNKNSTGSTGTWWSQKDGSTVSYSTTTGEFAGSTDPIYSTNVEGATKFGHWLQIEFPYKINYKYSDIQAPHHHIGRQPQAGYILGSNDLTGVWTSLHRFTDVFRNHKFKSVRHTPPTVSTQTFKYFRLVIEKLGGGNAHAGISRWDIFGTREQGQSVLHDGQLTLTKNLDVPRIGPDLDADDTPRRDRLIAEFNTSTNPTFEGAVRDTSGRGFDGCLKGNATYDANEKAITFDGTGDYIKMRDWNYGTGFVHSFSGWVKIKSPEESWTVVYGVGDASSASRTNFTIWALTNSDKFRTEADGTGGYIDHTFEFTYKLDQWMHIAVVKSDASIVSTRMYINGEILPQGAGSNQNEDIVMPNSPQNFNVGSYAPSPGSEINADYSNIKFYDVALTSAEIKTLYNMGRNGSVANPQPLHIAAPLYAPGTIVQVEQALKTDTFSTTGGSNHPLSPGNDVPGLVVTIHPKFGNSKILVSYTVSTGAYGRAYLRISRTQGGSTTYIQPSVAVPNSGQGRCTTSHNGGGEPDSQSFEYYDDADGTEPITYQIQAWTYHPSYYIYVNRGHADGFTPPTGDGSYWARTLSSITAKEVCQ